MDRRTLIEQGANERQADVIVQRASMLACWPHDVLVEHEPFDRPAGHVLVTAGRTKGRVQQFSVAPDGVLAT